jgi:serine/threonine-protein kinase HipA
VTRALSVWWDEALVGTLRVDRYGDMTFVYASTWLADSSRLPLSISLPKRPEPFKRRECRPFFAGLLPEDVQRRIIEKTLHISKQNDFQLLETLGGEVAGALTLWREDEPPPAAEVPNQPEPLDEGKLVEILDTLPRRPLLAGEGKLRLSLAGAQAKLPVILVDGKIALPAVGQPTTHILKPAIPNHAWTTENEALVMRLAARLGLAVAPVEARITHGRPYLLVTRYDRRVDEPGRIRRLHQEDFCQALGIVPEHKYAKEGGPTFATSFDLVRRAATRPAVEVLKLLDAAIFNVFVGNADAHGKNFSLLYERGTVSLAPLYDLLCTIVYPNLDPEFAMKIAKAATIEEIGTTTWLKFAEDVHIAARFLRERVKTLAETVPRAISDVIDPLADAGLNREAMRGQASVITARATRLAKTV